MNYKMACAVLLTLIFISGSVNAVPGMINYQGMLNVQGTPFSGSGDFYFAIVNSEGTTQYWSNDGNNPPTTAVTLTVANGLYEVILGDTSLTGMTQTVSSSVFSSDDLKLRIWFDDGTNGLQLLTPDQTIVSVGFSMKTQDAANADTFDNLDSPQFLRSDENDLMDGSLTITGDCNISGTIGVGDPSPEAKIFVKSVDDEDALRLENDAGRQLRIYRSSADGFWRIRTGDQLAFGEDSVDRLAITENGNVGIGTINPGVRLDVSGGNLRLDNDTKINFRNAAGNGSIMALSVNSNDNTLVNSTAGQAIMFQHEGNNHMCLRDGDLGIGTTLPNHKLHVVGNIKSTGIVRAENLNLGSDDTVYFDDSSNYYHFLTDGSNYAGLRCRNMNYRYSGGQAATILATDEGHLEFQHKNSWSSFDWTYNGTKLMTLGTGDGHLCLSGTANCEAGCDLAEKVVSSETAEPGDVVVIDTENHNRFRLASEPNCALVAGVVSTNPGLVLSDKTIDEIAYVGPKLCAYPEK